MTALGGIFASTDINANVFPRTVNIELSDGTFAPLTGSGFRGFTRAVAITSLTIDGVDIPQDDSNANWPSLAHFYMGSSVPEPDTLTLLGLGGLLVMVGYRLRVNR